MIMIKEIKIFLCELFSELFDRKECESKLKL